MKRRVCVLLSGIVAVGLLAAGSGCASPGSSGAEKSERSVELDRLDMLVGRWRGTSHAIMAPNGRIVAGKAESHVRWDIGRQFVLEETEYDLDQFGESSALGVWTWDATAGVYRTWRFDSGGRVSMGTADYDADARTWALKSETVGVRQGERSIGKGTIRYLSDKEKIWDWSSRTAEGVDAGYTAFGRSLRVSKKP